MGHHSFFAYQSWRSQASGPSIGASLGKGFCRHHERRRMKDDSCSLQFGKAGQAVGHCWWVPYPCRVCKSNGSWKRVFADIQMASFLVFGKGQEFICHCGKTSHFHPPCDELQVWKPQKPIGVSEGRTMLDTSPRCATAFLLVSAPPS